MTLEVTHYFVTVMCSCNLILQSRDNRSTSDKNPFNNRLTIVQQVQQSFKNRLKSFNNSLKIIQQSFNNSSTIV